MTASELLSQLRKLSFTLSAENDQLILKGPKDVLTPALRAQLSQRKAEILKLLQDAAPPGSALLRRVPRAKELCLSFAQQRLWFLDQLEPGKSLYNVSGALRLKGRLDSEALRRSLEEIVRRHEALRTTFSMSEAGPVQVISPVPQFTFLQEDIHCGTEEEAEAVIHLRGVAEAGRPFDLIRGPLFRAALVRVDTHDHVLFLTMHHIVSDGWSMGILYRELSALYRSFIKNEASPLAELPIQYADFAMWQREWLQREELERQLGYWKKQLSGIPGLLNLRTDRARPAIQTFRGKSQSVVLGKVLTEALKALNRQERVTLFMTLLATFQTLLYRYTGQEDIVVGAPIANRNRAEIEGLIGFFVNTLVLRSDLSGNPSFRELLGRVRMTALEAYEHQDLPFEKLVEELQPERSLSYSPLFQVMFVLQNAPSTGLELEGLSVSRLRLGAETAKFDLTLSMHETVEGLSGSLQYNTDLFDDATITRMLGHLQRLLEGVVAKPDERIGHLPILSEAEERQLLIEWNDGKTEYPRDKCIHELFEAQVEKTPDAIALVFEDQRLTYRELNNRANQLAHYLQKLGVGPEVLVGICVERSIEMVVGLLGILKAGGAYVPLDPSYPKERLAFVLEDTEAAVLLTQERLIEKLSDHNATIRCLDRDWGEIAGESQDNTVPFTTADNLAYVIYTSGSTGIPKGALITHQNVVRLFRATDSWFHFSPDDVWTLFHSYAFDFSVWELWGALLHGGRLVIVSSEMSRSPQEFYELLCREQVTVLNQTPSAFRQLVQAEESIVENNRLGLRLVIFGGEALEFQSLKPWFARHGDQRPQLINMYGITETTVHVTCRVIKESDLDAGMSNLIGVPIADLELYVLDPYLNLVPVGVAGELYVGGAGVARGYLNRAELTAERFIVSPFRSGKTLYRTGDLGRYLPNRDIEYLGRIDAQVKIRGYRIELGEIESVLSQHRSVSEAVLLARAEGAGDKQLIAYIVFNRNERCTVSELRSFLAGKLPDYMVPSAFVVLDCLPLTANGKVDRKALPAPDQNRPELDETFTAPRTPVEELLTQIWSDVLKVDKIGIHDNFFDLGGHSLLATQVILRVNNSFQIDIQLRRLFETPTIAGLASSIEASLGIENDCQGVPPIVPIPRSNEIPLSFAQQRLWFLDRIEPGNATYNVPAAFRLAGELKVDALEQSLTELVRRHEVLRTVFSTVSGVPVQTILPPSHMSLSYTDLSDRPESEREQAVTSTLSQEAERSFDLSRGPLIRAQLLRLASQDHVFFLTMHHIVSDGWSMGVLFRELSAHYAAYGSEQPSRLPELPIQYADYSVWQRNWLQGEKLEEHLSYWRKQLDGVSMLQLPTDHARPAVQSYRGASQNVDFSRELSQAIKALSQQEGVTLYMTLLAAFQLLLFRYSGQFDIAIGSPIAGRTRQETEGLIGFFVNTVVLRTDFSNDPIFRQLLRQVRETTLEAYSHQDLPFEKLVEELHPDRHLSNSPLFQVMFVFRNRADPPPEFEQLMVKPIRTVSHSAKFDLTLSMSEVNGALRGSLNYNTDLFDAATVERMLEHYKTLVEGIVANPEQCISELPLLTEPAKRQLLVEWNDTETDYPKDQSIHQIFETQVEKTPDAIALVLADQQLTYRELNNRANQLAHCLQKLGVGPEVLVGICVERSVEMVVGLLGILKAGGGYVPLDPSYPQERLRLMLQDSQPPVLITQQAFVDAFSRHTAKIISLDTDWEQVIKESSENPISGATAVNLAYVIYTSGSTGEPKGVAVSHRAINRLVMNTDYVEVSPAEVIAQASNISFDAATFEIWGALLNGARIVLIDKGTLLSPQSLAAAIERHSITTLFLTTALFNQMAEQIPAALGKLSYLLFGGETADSQRVKELLREGPPKRLLHVYGPTEATTFASCYWVKALAADATTVPIGRPIANTEIYILDAHLNPAPIGVSGELYIGGPGLARGYLNRAELTAEKFIKHPFSADPTSRLYKTGDRARYLPDGNIEFLGRLDNQVKIRGFRVELGEIEAALNQHPAVKDNVVVMRNGASGDKRLVAYVVPEQHDGHDGPASSELRSYLRAKLPSYMLPSAYIKLEAFVLTTNGKLDYDSLPPPGSQDEQEAVQYVAPRDHTERLLCGIWSQVLGVNRIGIDDDFFAIGGHSLLAAKLFARLDEAFGRSLPLGVLFTASTIRSLAERYRSTVEPRGRSVIVPLRTGASLPPIFAVPGVFGNVICFADLARELGSEQPFYGLQSIGLDGTDAPVDSIEAMARVYLKEMESIQPPGHGPYVILGACFGATVAYEMARQLLAAGEEVAFLGLLDPTRREGNIVDKNPESTARIFKRVAAFRTLALERLQLYREEMQRLGVLDRVKYVGFKFQLLSALIGNRNAFKGAARELNQIEVYRANVLALDRYRREPLNGRLRTVEIFQTTRLSRVNVPDGIRWRAFWDGQIQQHQVPGKDSGDMLSGENARVLAALLARRLQMAFCASHQHDSRPSPRI